MTFGQRAMRALLIDLDGVLYVGDKAVSGAADVLRWLQDNAIPHLFVTNTTSRPRRDLVARLAGFGIHVTEDLLHTPAVAARRWLMDHAVSPLALFVPAATREEFRDLERVPESAERGAGAVVVGDLGEQWDFRTLNRAFRLLMDDPPPALIALGMTRYWRASDGLRLDVAPFVKALEHAAGREATVLGKPSKAFFEAALLALGCGAHDAVMIGDDIVGDVHGAQAAGITGVLVRTGKFRDADLSGDVHPDVVLDSIAELPSWWSDNAPHDNPQ